MQGLMGRYLEQSASAFLDMQQQMQKQTRNLFGTFPFPNFARRQSVRAAGDGEDAAQARTDTPPRMKAATKQAPEPALPASPRVPRRRPRSVSFRSAAPRRWSIPNASSPQLRAEGY